MLGMPRSSFRIRLRIPKSGVKTLNNTGNFCECFKQGCGVGVGMDGVNARIGVDRSRPFWLQLESERNL